MIALAAIWRFLKGIPWQLWIVLALIAAIWWHGSAMYAKGYDTANGEWQARADKITAEYQARMIEAQAKAAAELAEANVRMGEIERKTLAEKEAINAQHEKTLADLRSGTLRVRGLFQCPSDSVSGSSAATGSGNAGGQAGFTAEDAGIALGIARDGDAAIIQLGRAQEVIREYQAICGAKEQP